MQSGGPALPQGLSRTPLQLLRLPQLAWYLLRLQLADSPRQRRRLWADQQQLLGYVLPLHTLVLLLGLVFCVASPLIAPVALLYFVSASIAQRYQWIYIYRWGPLLLHSTGMQHNAAQCCVWTMCANKQGSVMSRGQPELLSGAVHDQQTYLSAVLITTLLLASCALPCAGTAMRVPARCGVRCSPRCVAGWLAGVRSPVIPVGLARISVLGAAGSMFVDTGIGVPTLYMIWSCAGQFLFVSAAPGMVRPPSPAAEAILNYAVHDLLAHLSSPFHRFGQSWDMHS